MGREPADWLLSQEERGNPRTTLDDAHPDGTAWSTGNLVSPLVDGAVYFAELADKIAATGPGDLIYFTDWRGDPDERLTGEEGSEVETLLSAAASTASTSLPGSPVRRSSGSPRQSVK